MSSAHVCLTGSEIFKLKSVSQDIKENTRRTQNRFLF